MTMAWNPRDHDPEWPFEHQETSFALDQFPERVRADEVNYENAQKATVAKGGAILDAVVEGVAGEVLSLLDR